MKERRDFRVRHENFGQLFCEVHGVAGGETKPLQAFHLRNPFQQLREAASAIEGIDILAEQLHFAISTFHHTTDLSYDVLPGAIALHATSGRNDAVGASMVATFDDGHKGFSGALAPCDFGRKQVVVRVFACIHNEFFSGLGFFHQTR